MIRSGESLDIPTPQYISDGEQGRDVIGTRLDANEEQCFYFDLFFIHIIIVDSTNLYTYIIGVRLGNDRMVVGFITTYVISAYHL